MSYQKTFELSYEIWKLVDQDCRDKNIGIYKEKTENVITNQAVMFYSTTTREAETVMLKSRNSGSYMEA